MKELISGPKHFHRPILRAEPLLRGVGLEPSPAEPCGRLEPKPGPKQGRPAAISTGQAERAGTSRREIGEWPFPPTPSPLPHLHLTYQGGLPLMEGASLAHMGSIK